MSEDAYKPITLEAHALVFGDRQASYGHPLDDFSCTAAMWTAYLQHRGLLIPGAQIDAEDFGPMMILAKVSRQANCPKRDNLTDAAGYAETTERVIHERARRDRFQSEIAEYRDLMAETGVTEADMQPVAAVPPEPLTAEPVLSETERRARLMFSRFGLDLQKQAQAQGDLL